MELIQNLQSLAKALEAGVPGGAPHTLVQGAALQGEDLSTVMHNLCFEDKALKLQKVVSIEPCKSIYAQFVRQLSYGRAGGSAQLEGHVGKEQTGQYIRATVPMCYYAHFRRTTLVANMIQTFDGVKATEREASNAAKTIAFDIEFETFRGSADFSNGGIFDGHPSAMWQGPGMHGVDLQIRQSDSIRNTRDQMFASFGSDDSVVIPGGGTLTQEMIEDATTRSAMNFGQADRLFVDPKVLSNYNKLSIAMQRVALAGSPQTSLGTELSMQNTATGGCKVEASRFLSGRTAPDESVSAGPPAPTIAVASVTDATAPTAFTAGRVYRFYVTSVNEVGESPKTAESSVTVATTADKLNVTITHPGSGTPRYFNVYRSLAGGAAGTAKFIGRVLLSVGAATTVFSDLGNKLPGFVTGFLLETDTMAFRELASYSRLKLPATDLSEVEAHYRFTTLIVYQPRKNCLIDNLK